MAAAWPGLLIAFLLAQSQAHGYHYVGCYGDGDNRDLPVRAARGSMSPGRCNQMCTSQNYKFFGLQDGSECWCGNSFGKYGAKLNECNRRCDGQETEFCGTGWRNNIYTTDFSSGMNYVGCFNDRDERDLDGYSQSGGMSVDKCYNICRSRGFAYFGVQHADLCFCGNSYGRYGARHNSECNMLCNGDRSVLCGGSARNSVYETGLPVPKPTVTTSGLRIRDSMAAKLSSMYSPIPRGVFCPSCLITVLGRDKMEHRSNNLTMSDLNSTLASYPEKARAKLLALQFGENATTTFEDSHIRLIPTHATRSSYFGMAERVDDRILIGMVNAVVSAALVPKYNVLPRKVCQRILFWDRCHNEFYSERRGYRADEIRHVDNALLTETNKALMENLKFISV